MKIKVLASGSKGNSTYIECDKTKLLIDVGISLGKIVNFLETIEVSPKEIDAVLITHCHHDHISGLASFIKKTNALVYIPIDLLKDIKSIVPIDRIVIVKGEYNIEDINIKILNASHDFTCFGYILTHQDSSLLYLTDTGYINSKYKELTKNKDIYIIEANHDEKMLMEGPHPYPVKQRVISDVGHLSNRYTGKYLAKCIGDKTQYIFLAHLSDKNNTPELALEQVREELAETNFDPERIIIADQYVASEEIEV